MAPHDEHVLILDYGSQYTKLIARRIRELRVYCTVRRGDLGAEALRAAAPSAVVLSGGPGSVYDDGAPRPDPAVYELGVPVLGICYGLQAMIRDFGGRVAASDHREFGRAELPTPPDGGALFERLEREAFPLTVWMSHGDRIEDAGEAFEVLARSRDGLPAALAHRDRPLHGVQFHPEVTHTPRGLDVLRAFLFDVAGLAGTWTTGRFLDETVAALRERVGDDERVVCGLSGGVDSSVAAVLLHRAIGDRLRCVFVDNGLLRQGEAEQVVRTFRDHHGIPLRFVDARDRFLEALAGVEDPEVKRQRIGRAFIEVFEAEAGAIEGARWLAQGTLYPDVIESVSTGGPSAHIKSHHNVGGLPEEMGLELLEPLRELFKDEVRELGRALGLPEAIVGRRPFPGPGLAIRVLGEVTAERLELVREADAIAREEIDALPEGGSGPSADEVWQAFAVLLPVRSVGIMGDARTYEHVCAVRAVGSVDGMTADWSPLPHDTLGRIGSRIINEVAGINRVVYDVSSKPPATIEWE